VNGAEVFRLLVADGDAKMRQLVRANLSVIGFEVLEARDAWECLRMAWREKPDMIILDLDLPDHTGWEVISLMDLSGKLIDVEIIVTSGDTPSPVVLQKYGATDFAKKPYDIRCLMHQVERAAGLRRARSANQHRRGSSEGIRAKVTRNADGRI